MAPGIAGAWVNAGVVMITVRHLFLMWKDTHEALCFVDVEEYHTHPNRIDRSSTSNRKGCWLICAMCNVSLRVSEGNEPAL